MLARELNFEVFWSCRRLGLHVFFLKMPLHAFSEEVFLITLAALISHLFFMYHPLVDNAIIHPFSFILTKVTFNNVTFKDGLWTMIQFHMLF